MGIPSRFAAILIGAATGLALTGRPPDGVAQPTATGGGILVYRTGRLVVLDPSGKTEVRLTEDKRRFAPSGACRLSPDRKTVAVLLPASEPKPGANPDLKKVVYLRGPADKEPGRPLNIQAERVVWSPSGDRLACTHDRLALDRPGTHSIVEVGTGKKTPLVLPPGHSITDWSADGKWFITTGVAKGPPVTVRVYRVSVDGKQITPLTSEKEFAAEGRLSPDGKWLLYARSVPPKGADDPSRQELVVKDVAGGESKLVAGGPGVSIGAGCWSPDGKRVAFTTGQVHPASAGAKATESRLVVADADGKNATVIATETAADPFSVTLGSPDWR